MPFSAISAVFAGEGLGPCRQTFARCRAWRMGELPATKQWGRSSSSIRPLPPLTRRSFRVLMRVFCLAGSQAKLSAWL